MAKAASGLLLRPGWAARLLLACAMAAAAWPLAAWLWTLAAFGEVHAVAKSGGPVLLVVAVHVVIGVASLSVVIPGCAGAPDIGRRRRTRLAGEAPLILWAALTLDGRVTAWRALLWILLWPAELLACLWVACWWLAAAAGAAMDFTICRRGGARR
jgi:hypothetical protein